MFYGNLHRIQRSSIDKHLALPVIHTNKSFINCANLRSMHNWVENGIFFNICVDNHPFGFYLYISIKS